ncbi:hypothetical protein ACVXZY_11035 [Staphylococcus aureus]
MKKKINYWLLKLTNINEQYLQMQAQVSDLSAQINHMETDTTLANLRHEYHSLKNQLNDIAKIRQV